MIMGNAITGKMIDKNQHLCHAGLTVIETQINFTIMGKSFCMS